MRILIIWLLKKLIFLINLLINLRTSRFNYDHCTSNIRMQTSKINNFNNPRQWIPHPLPKMIEISVMPNPPILAISLYFEKKRENAVQILQNLAAEDPQHAAISAFLRGMPGVDFRPGVFCLKQCLVSSSWIQSSNLAGCHFQP